jgi:hypothetical protein
MSLSITRAFFRSLRSARSSHARAAFGSAGMCCAMTLGAAAGRVM